MTFDYGKKLPDGQHEKHPINVEGDYIAPIRETYIHKTCNAATKIGSLIAETYARNPKYYTRTFCAECRDYFPIAEFNWKSDGIELGQIVQDVEEEK